MTLMGWGGADGLLPLGRNTFLNYGFEGENN